MVGAGGRERRALPPCKEWSAIVAPLTKINPAPGPLDRYVQAQIGRELRTLYGELLREPVPDHLLDLITRLDLIAQRSL